MSDKETNLLDKIDNNASPSILENISNTTSSIFDSVNEKINDVSKDVGELVTSSSNIISNNSSGATENINKSVDIVQNNINEYFENSSSVFVSIIFLLALSIIIGGALYYFLSENIINQKRKVIEGTEVPVLCNNLTEYKISNILNNSNGKRKTIGFWIYIDDINKYSGSNYRHILHIGSKAENVTDASPYIILDNVSNKMYLRFAPDKDDKYDKKLNEETDIRNLLYDGNNVRGIEISYIPIQRWVHVAVSINDSFGGSISIFIDGELSKVLDADYYKKTDSNKILNVSELNLESSGSLWVGGNIFDKQKGLTGFSGLISKVTLFNYDLNKNDIYKEYSLGPFNSMMSSMGLDGYGLRNPVYKLNVYN